MPDTEQPVILCIASYEKGFDFLRECHARGGRPVLLTSRSLENVAWPRESLHDIFFMPDVDKEWNSGDMVKAVSYLARRMPFHRIVALDDFDVEKAALLREHLRVPGIGDSQARLFRDKLAMRTSAKQAGLPVPPFTATFPHSQVQEFLNAVAPPYLVKPRTQAGAIGIKKCQSAQEVWDVLTALGDAQADYLIESFVAGAIYHVDSLVQGGQVVFAQVSVYARPPLEVYHQGRVFATRTVPYGSTVDTVLKDLNAKLLSAFGMEYGVSHSEYIVGPDGSAYFLETSARVGGANIAEMVEAASGINLWREWAKLECAADPSEYRLPEIRQEHAGLLVCLARQETPDLATYTDPEICFRRNHDHHVGLIVRSPEHERIVDLVDRYTERFYTDFFATLPARDKATT